MDSAPSLQTTVLPFYSPILGHNFIGSNQQRAQVLRIKLQIIIVDLKHRYSLCEKCDVSNERYALGHFRIVKQFHTHPRNDGYNLGTILLHLA